MPQKLPPVLCIIAMLLIVSTPLYACSSFAVYAKHPVYGMNFDYDLFPMKFLISETENIKTFQLAFQRPINGRMTWVCTAGMNDKGLFASCQEELPYAENPPPPKDDEIYVHQLYTRVSSYGKTADIIKLCSQKKLVQHEAVSVHNLFADKYGSAVITEADTGGNRLMKIKGQFIVMTNFRNRSIEGKNYKDAGGAGPGDERYITAHEYIKEHFDCFNISSGMELLEKLNNTDPKYPTYCSMVFDPQNSEIYIAINRNYRKIFKVSIKNNKIETLRGFITYRKACLDSQGVLVSSLKNWD